MGVLYQNYHRLVTVHGLGRVSRLGSALDLRKDLLYVYFMNYIKDYARGPDLTIIGKKDNHYLL